jgi:hypothetical protein
MDNIRFKIASWLVSLANRIYKKHPKVMQFYTKVITDYTIAGNSFVRINPEEIYKKVIDEIEKK